MGKDSNIVHQYFRKEFDGMIILVKVNPIQWTGTELTLLPSGKVERRELEFGEDILEDLKVNGFEGASAMEFNLYLSGLVG